MKTSELIKLLQENIDQFGDLPITNPDYASDAKLTPIDKDGHDAYNKRTAVELVVDIF